MMDSARPGLKKAPIRMTPSKRDRLAILELLLDQDGFSARLWSHRQPTKKGSILCRELALIKGHHKEVVTRVDV
jgi:hypothetical protein